MSLFDERDMAAITSPRVSWRAVDRLPQPRSRSRARPQARRPHRRHRARSGQDRRRRDAQDAPATRRSRDRRRDRRRARQVQGRQALRSDDRGRPVRLCPEGREIAEETALDGLYAVRTSLPEETIADAATVKAYKSLAQVERAFRCLKTVDLHVRPIYHWLEDRVRAHVFLCMLAY